MPLRLIVMTAAVALAPAVSAAANFRVLLNVEHVEVVPRSEDQTVFLDVYVTDLDNTTEYLRNFAVLVRGPLNTRDVVRFVPPVLPPSTEHPYVFRNMGVGPPYDLLSDHAIMRVYGGDQVPVPGVGRL